MGTEGVDGFIDQRGRIWIDGLQTLVVYDTLTHKIVVQFHREAAGTPVYFKAGFQSMIEDANGNIWIGTNGNGLYRYFPHKIGGFNAFLPSVVKDDTFQPPIVLTDFKLANKSVDIKSEGSPLKTDISQTKELVLTWRDNIFSFEFAALDFTEPGRNQYAYKLENFDEDWQYIGTQRNATFTNLDPGEYIFRVKGANHDGTWNEAGASLKITILPPWWKTWWAWLGYVLLFGAAAYWFYKFQLNRKLEHAEAEKIKEMDRLKTRTTEPTLDDIFMQTIHRAIEEKMGDTNLGIEQLCHAVHLSSAQLFRKMKALTGESPYRFIQKKRLQKAHELLRTTSLNVSEIAYELGFTDPNYFSRAFSKEFGMSPSDVRK